MRTLHGHLNKVTNVVLFESILRRRESSSVCWLVNPKQPVYDLYNWSVRVADMNHFLYSGLHLSTVCLCNSNHAPLWSLNLHPKPSEPLPHMTSPETLRQLDHLSRYYLDTCKKICLNFPLCFWSALPPIFPLGPTEMLVWPRAASRHVWRLPGATVPPCIVPKPRLCASSHPYNTKCLLWPRLFFSSALFGTHCCAKHTHRALNRTADTLWAFCLICHSCSIEIFLSNESQSTCSPSSILQQIYSLYKIAAWQWTGGYFRWSAQIKQAVQLCVTVSFVISQT